MTNLQRADMLNQMVGPEVAVSSSEVTGNLFQETPVQAHECHVVLPACAVASDRGAFKALGKSAAREDGFLLLQLLERQGQICSRLSVHLIAVPPS